MVPCLKHNKRLLLRRTSLLLCRHFAQVARKYVLTFGKHKGKSLGQVDDAYLVWLTTAHGEWLAEAAAGILEERKRSRVLNLRKDRAISNDQLLLSDLKSCGIRRDLECGRRIHARASGSGHDSSIRVATALVSMYAKCGSMVDARRVFDSIGHPDVVSWTSLLLGYAENGEGVTALYLFAAMKLHACAPNSITYVAVIKACTALTEKEAKLECLERGKQIHSEIGCHLNLYVQNTLIDMYAKCGSMVDARQVFDNVKHPDVASWNVLISGYAENGEGSTALDLFSRMKLYGCWPNTITYVAALKACGLLGALKYGRQIHAEITEFNATVVTSLVDFYTKCGSLVDAQEVFDLHPGTRTLTTWTALLAGYSRFGETDSVFGLFEKMQDAGFQPDGVAFLCVLMCCSHAGLVDKAVHCFEAMSAEHRLTPTVKHYNCMVDVLGRANRLDDVLAMLSGMPCSPNEVTWNTVLGACRKWKHVELGMLAFHCLLSLDNGDAAAYVVMAHIYASRGMWKEREMVLAMRKNC